MKASSSNRYERTTMLRSFLLLIFVLGVIGGAAELLLLGHTEDWRQWVPLTLFLLSFPVLLFHVIVRRAVTLRILQATMLMFILAA